MTRLVGKRELDNCRCNFQLTVKLSDFGSVVNRSFFSCKARIITSESAGFCEASMNDTPKTISPGPDS